MIKQRLNSNIQICFLFKHNGGSKNAVDSLGIEFGIPGTAPLCLQE